MSELTGTPYSRDVVGVCNGHSCRMVFPEVPAGKLLVIRNLGAIARPTSPSTRMDFAELITSNPDAFDYPVRNYFPLRLIGVAGTSIGSNSWAMNKALLAFVLAGQSARVTLVNRQYGVVFFSQATISGYMVDAP